MEAKADEYREKKRQNALILVASARGYLADVEELLQRGADINARDKKNLTALHFAAGRGWLDIVRLLWSKAADLDAESSTGCSPLYLAALNGHEEVVSFLLSKGAILSIEDSEENTPLHAAARGGHASIAALLISNGASVHAKNKLSLSPGGAALLHGHVQVAEKLQEEGWDPVNERIGGFSLLHLAAGVSQADAMVWLLREKAGSINDANNPEKATPLHCAAVAADPECCQLLLDAGASLVVRDAAGRLPLDCIGDDAPKELAIKVKSLLQPTEEAIKATSAKSAKMTAAPGVKKADTSSETEQESRQKAFLALSYQDRIRRARYWSTLSTQDLNDALQGYPGAEEVKRRVQMAAELRKSGEIFKAMAALRADEEFQLDISQPEVFAAVGKLRENPGLYDKFAQDPRIVSVVAKMRRIHMVVQANGRRNFNIEDIIVAPQKINERQKEDAAKLEMGLKDVECHLVAAAAAAAVKEAAEAGAAAETGYRDSKEGREIVEEEKEVVPETKEERVEEIEEIEEVAEPVPERVVYHGEEVEMQRQWPMAVVAAALILAWILSIIVRNQLRGRIMEMTGLEGECHDSSEL